jgi:hypothetical protein
MALEIQQLLDSGESNQVSPTLLKPSQSFSHLEMSTSSLSFNQSQELCSQYSRDLSLVSGCTVSQLKVQKFITQSTGAMGIQHHWPNHLQQEQEFQAPNVSEDAGTLTSSSLEEPGIPVNHQKRRKNNSTSAQKNQGQNPLNTWLPLFPWTQSS